MTCDGAPDLEFPGVQSTESVEDNISASSLEGSRIPEPVQVRAEVWEGLDSGEVPIAGCEVRASQLLQHSSTSPYRSIAESTEGKRQAEVEGRKGRGRIWVW